MKLAHYLHIAPRTLFIAQGMATLIGAVVQCGVTVFMITRIHSVCTPKAAGGFSCPHGAVTYSSSLIWGKSDLFPTWVTFVHMCCARQAPRFASTWSNLWGLTLPGALGPERNFSPGHIYGNLLWFFLVGPVVVVLTWLLGRRWKKFNYLSWPVAFGAMSLVPPATGINFSSWWVVNVIFNGILKRRKPAWWSKYSAFTLGSCNLVLVSLSTNQIRLRAVRCPRCRSRRCDGHYFLLHHPAGGQTELVGEFGV